MARLLVRRVAVDAGLTHGKTETCTPTRRASTPYNSTMTDPGWYYLQNGVTAGPVSQDAAVDMVRNGIIRGDTLVWSGGGEWVAAAHSALATALVNSPPPAGASLPQIAPASKHEEFAINEVRPVLEPGERIEMTALLFTGSLLRLAAASAALGAIGAAATGAARTQLFFGVATDRRLLLIGTKMGLLAIKDINLGLFEVRFDEVSRVDLGGTLNQRTATFQLLNGSSVMIRLNSLSGLMSGQGVFLERLPQLVAGRIGALRPR